MIPTDTNEYKTPHIPRGFKSLATKEMVGRPFVLHQLGTLTSSAGGTITTVLSMDPSGFPDWGQIVNYYDEFRVMGVRLILMCVQQTSIATTQNLGWIVFDNDDTSVIGSGNSGAQFVHKYVVPSQFTHINGKSPELMFKRPVSKTSPVIWRDVAAPATSDGSIKFYFDGLSVSTKYFQYYVEYFVEARGRR